MTGSPRGRWDRAQSTGERRRARRAAIVHATARALAEHGDGATVAHVVALAGVGRNTFYEHFTSAEDALTEVQSQGAAELLRSLEDAAVAERTPVERLRAICRTWVDAAASQPTARALLRAPDGAGSPRAELRGDVERLLSAVVAEARASGRVSLPPDRARVAAVSGAFERVGRVVSDDPRIDRGQFAEVLVDLVLRVFR